MQSVTASRAPVARRAVWGAIALVGFSAVAGQIVLMRELIAVFNGNEISLGIMLATWLFWTALGSYLSSRIKLGEHNSARTVATLECLFGIMLLPTIWMVRASRSIFQTVPGELIGPVPMILTSVACLSVFCVLSGCLFVAAMRMYAQAHRTSARTTASTAYLLEAAGSAAGGIVASLLLLRWCNSFEVAAVLLLLNVSMALILLGPTRPMQALSAGLGIATLGALLFTSLAPWLEQSSQAHLWNGFHLLETRDSIYGKLAVIQTGNLRSVYDNGILLASAPDENAAEEGVHYALLEHAAPRRVLLIGGGMSGGIAQALKHSTLERLDYVELDPTLISIASQYFSEPSRALYDPRAHLHYSDGRHYLNTVPDKFDVIIVDVPDPQTAQLNRFYTREFFASARNHLQPEGLLALQLRASEDYISPDLGEFLRCIYQTLHQVFPEIAVIPGETIHFFAATQPDALTENPETLISRLRSRNIETHYVREYFLPFRMTPDRMEQVHELLKAPSAAPINRDFAPIAYYFNTELWSAQFGSVYARWLRNAAQHNFFSIVAWSFVALALLAIFIARRPRRARASRSTAAFCVAATGFTLMAQQIFLLLLFQSIYGFVYHQLAILISMFMAGIAVGTWWALRRVNSKTNLRLMQTAAYVQLLLAASVPMLMFVVDWLGRTSQASTMLLASQILFPLLAAISGLPGGYQFPIATEIYLDEARASRSLGTLYALDLLGGCAAALLLSGYLIAVYGFWKTAWFIAAVNLAPAVLAAFVSREPTAVEPQALSAR